MIKPFEFIKVLVSFVCTVPNARNTRRSTALGETPLIWYCARYPNRPIPLWIQSLLGVAVARREEVCIIGYPVSFLCTVCCMHSSKAVASSLQSFPNSFRGTGGLGGIQVLKKGGKVCEVPKSFCCNRQQSKKAKPAPVDVEYGRKKGLWCILHNVTVT